MTVISQPESARVETLTTIWFGFCFGKGIVCFSRTSNPPVFETAIAWIVLGKDIFTNVVLEKWRESWFIRIPAENSGIAFESVRLEVKRKDGVMGFRNMQS